MRFHIELFAFTKSRESVIDVKWNDGTFIVQLRATISTGDVRDKKVTRLHNIQVKRFSIGRSDCHVSACMKVSQTERMLLNDRTTGTRRREKG